MGSPGVSSVLVNLGMTEVMANDSDARAAGKALFNPKGTSKMGQMNLTLQFSIKKHH